MRKDWEVRKLGDVCDVISGQSPESKYYNINGQGLPFYQGKKEFGKRYISSPAKWTTKITKEALKNDILISVRAPVGPVNFATERICIGRGLASIRCRQEINKDFLFYFLQNNESSLKGNEGAVFNSINKTQIVNIEIPIPPLKEQKKIVEKLEKVFKIIDKAKANIEKNIANSKELFQSKLNEIFYFRGEGWEVRKLGDVAKIKGGKRLTKGKKLLKEKTKYPYIRVADFNDNGSVNVKSVQYIESNVYDMIKNYTISDKDLYISIAGTIGKSGIIPSSLNGANLTENACKLVFYENIYNKFVYYYTQNYEFKRQVGMNTRTTAMPKLALTRLASITIPIPPLKEQKEIVENLNKLSENIERIKLIKETKLTNLQELKKSILQKAFKEELTKKNK